jgi:hypothetical protein
MDPVIQPKSLYLWQGVDAAMDASADPSLFQLKEERIRARALYQNQPEETRSFFQRQAASIADALLEYKNKLDFSLPEFVSLPNARTGAYRPVEVPEDFRRQSISGFLGRLARKDVRSAFRQRLTRLEESMYPAVIAGAGLLRYSVARSIVRDRIPQIPAATISAERDFSQLNGGSYDAMNEPVAFEIIERQLDQHRRWIETLHQALSLAPYIFTDEEYQSKRAAVLGRLLPLGNAAAHGQVRQMIATIIRRAEAGDLNRGLSLSLPYFDDRALEMKLHEFEVIPPGRTMFVPVFVALAAARELERIEQNDALSPSTRMHLLEEMKNLQRAFGPGVL